MQCWIWICSCLHWLSILLLCSSVWTLNNVVLIFVLMFRCLMMMLDMHKVVHLKLFLILVGLLLYTFSRIFPTYWGLNDIVISFVNFIDGVIEVCMFFQNWSLKCWLFLQFERRDFFNAVEIGWQFGKRVISLWMYQKYIVDLKLWICWINL